MIPPEGGEAGVALAGLIDVETTGLDPRRDEVVELALLLFAFQRETGRILDVVDEYTGLREPGCPISRGAARVHGLTLDQLRGCRLDTARLQAMVARAEFLVAHNARFDRAFVGRLLPMVLAKPWLCSMRSIDWQGHGFPSRRLQALLRQHGIAAGRSHRSGSDARATLALLARPAPAGHPYFRELIGSGAVPARAAGNGRPLPYGAPPGPTSALAQPGHGCGGP